MILAEFFIMATKGSGKAASTRIEDPADSDFPAIELVEFGGGGGVSRKELVAAGARVHTSSRRIRGG